MLDATSPRAWQPPSGDTAPHSDQWRFLQHSSVRLTEIVVQAHVRIHSPRMKLIHNAKRHSILCSAYIKPAYLQVFLGTVKHIAETLQFRTSDSDGPLLQLERRCRLEPTSVYLYLKSLSAKMAYPSGKRCR